MFFLCVCFRTSSQRWLEVAKRELRVSNCLYGALLQCLGAPFSCLFYGTSTVHIKQKSQKLFWGRPRVDFWVDFLEFKWKAQKRQKQRKILSGISDGLCPNQIKAVYSMQMLWISKMIRFLDTICLPTKCISERVTKRWRHAFGLSYNMHPVSLSWAPLELASLCLVSFSSLKCCSGCEKKKLLSSSQQQWHGLLFMLPKPIILFSRGIARFAKLVDLSMVRLGF